MSTARQRSIPSACGGGRHEAAPPSIARPAATTPPQPPHPPRRATLAEMTGSGFSGLQRMDFDALYRGESPGEGIPPMATPPWDTKAPKDSVVAWHGGGWVHGDVLDIGCGLGDNAIYLARNGFRVTGLDISPTALVTAQRRAHEAGADVTFAVADSTKLEGFTDAFDTVIDSGMFTCVTYTTANRGASRLAP